MFFLLPSFEGGGGARRHSSRIYPVTDTHTRRELTQSCHAASIPEPQREAWTKHQVKAFKDKDGFENELVRHVETTLARSMFNCDESAAYAATSLAFRDRLILEWNRTQQRQTFADSKRVYYLSLEFLMGRALDNAMLNIGQKDLAKAGLADLGFRIEDIIDQEHDAALGNGGLGRLAACFLDSLASLNFPAWGYGLRYRYGIFKQTIVDGFQVEEPDYWLDFVRLQNHSFVTRDADICTEPVGIPPPGCDR